MNELEHDFVLDLTDLIFDDKYYLNAKTKLRTKIDEDSSKKGKLIKVKEISPDVSEKIKNVKKSNQKHELSKDICKFKSKQKSLKNSKLDNIIPSKIEFNLTKFPYKSGGVSASEITDKEKYKEEIIKNFGKSKEKTSLNDSNQETRNGESIFNNKNETNSIEIKCKKINPNTNKNNNKNYNDTIKDNLNLNLQDYLFKNDRLRDPIKFKSNEEVNAKKNNDQSLICSTGSYYSKSQTSSNQKDYKHYKNSESKKDSEYKHNTKHSSSHHHKHHKSHRNHSDSRKDSDNRHRSVYESIKNKYGDSHKYPKLSDDHSINKTHFTSTSDSKHGNMLSSPNNSRYSNLNFPLSSKYHERSKSPNLGVKNYAGDLPYSKPDDPMFLEKLNSFKIKFSRLFDMSRERSELKDFKEKNINLHNFNSDLDYYSIENKILINNSDVKKSDSSTSPYLNFYKSTFEDKKLQRHLFLDSQLRLNFLKRYVENKSSITSSYHFSILNNRVEEIISHSECPENSKKIYYIKLAKGEDNLTENMNNFSKVYVTENILQRKQGHI